MSELISDQFQNLIHERHSTRTAFDGKHLIAKKDLLQILDAGSWAPTAHNMQNFEIIVVDDKKKLGAISQIESPMSEIFIRENLPQLSFSVDELKKKKVGLLGTMFPKEMLKPDISEEDIKKFGPNNVGRFIETSSMLVVMLYDPSRRAPASEGDFLGIMSLGCVMENMWLMAQSLGIAFHIVSSLSNNQVEQEVKSILGIPDNLKIAISFRLGYATFDMKNYLRVRRDVEDFTFQNEYGKRLPI